jgi:hypothetical protein
VVVESGFRLILTAGTPNNQLVVVSS